MAPEGTPRNILRVWANHSADVRLVTVIGRQIHGVTEVENIFPDEEKVVWAVRQPITADNILAHITMLGAIRNGPPEMLFQRIWMNVSARIQTPLLLSGDFDGSDQSLPAGFSMEEMYIKFPDPGDIVWKDFGQLPRNMWPAGGDDTQKFIVRAAVVTRQAAR